MPQMMPLNWLMLFFFFVFLYMLFFMLLYYNFNFTKSSLKKKYNSQINWKW